LPPDLSRLVKLWPTLAGGVRAAIVEMAERGDVGSEPSDSPGRLAWQQLPEKTRASLVESIGNAMKNLLEGDEREVRALDESMERETQHVNEHTGASDE